MSETLSLDNIRRVVREELESAMKDADRYRWLRDWAGGETITQLSHIEPDAWDAFVDGEMEETR